MPSGRVVSKVFFPRELHDWPSSTAFLAAGARSGNRAQPGGRYRQTGLGAELIQNVFVSKTSGISGADARSGVWFARRDSRNIETLSATEFTEPGFFSIMASKRSITYPFVPRSTAHLVPGQFWAIPLSDGSFGCGRVIELAPRGEVGGRTSFLAAVLDWHSSAPPSYEAIAGAKCLDQGCVHLKAVTETGGSILGRRPLELDGIEPWLFRQTAFYKNSWLLKGLQPLRPQEPADVRYPVFSTWGYPMPAVIAEKHFIAEAK